MLLYVNNYQVPSDVYKALPREGQKKRRGEEEEERRNKDDFQ